MCPRKSQDREVLTAPLFVIGLTPRRISCTVRGWKADPVRMGLCKARAKATTTTDSHDGIQGKDKKTKRHQRGRSPRAGGLDTHGYGRPQITDDGITCIP